MTPTPAGEKNQRVTFQNPTRTTTAGVTSVAWETVREVWAKVMPRKAWQVERSRQVQMNATHDVTVDYASDVAGDWRILWRGHTLDIKGIVNVEGANVELEIACEQEGLATA